MVLIVICATLWLFNIAKENGPFIDNVHIKPSIYNRLSIAMLNSQMVYIYIYVVHTLMLAATRPFKHRSCRGGSMCVYIYT